MKTTGRVLVNARGMKINGYDCFVNLSKVNKDNKTDYIIRQWTEITPISGYQTFIKPDTSNIKISPCTFSISNSYGFYLSTNETTYPTYCTIATWIKWVNLFTQSVANGKHQYIKDHFNGQCIGGNVNYFWNDTRKIIETLDLSNNSWTSTNISTNYSSGWHYITLTKSNKQLYFFIDGVLLLSKTINTWPNFSYLVFGELAQTGYYDDIVVIADQCLWTSNFTPPSTYLLDSDHELAKNYITANNIILSTVDPSLVISKNKSILKMY